MKVLTIQAPIKVQILLATMMVNLLDVWIISIQDVWIINMLDSMMDSMMVN